MSYRLQVLIPEPLEREVRKAAERRRVSTGAWVRAAIERALREPARSVDALDELERIGAPTADIDRMLDEIEAGRR